METPSMAKRKTKDRCVAKKEWRLWWNKRERRGDKVLQGAVEIEEGLGRHRDCEESVVEGGRWTKEGLGTTRRNLGDHPSRVHTVSGGRGLNTGILDSVEEQMSVLWLKDGPT